MSVNVKMYDSEIAVLKYPRDRARIARLSISGFQCWYSSQNPQDMVFLGQIKEFQRFIFWNYTIKVKLLRFYYRIRNLLRIR